MRRLVIGIMLALFAVGAYSQEDDIYALSKETKSKGNKARIEYLSSKVRLTDEEDSELYLRKNAWGEWTTKEGQLVSINRNEIEIDGKKEITLNTGYSLIKSYGLILSNCLIKTYSPIMGAKDEYCTIEIAVYDEDHIMVTVEKEKSKTYRLTRVK